MNVIIKRLGIPAGALALGIFIGIAFLMFSTPLKCAEAAGTCPVGSTAVFTNNWAYQGGSAFTVTFSGTPTVGDATITIPDTAGVADTFVFNTTTATLANKTLTSPILNTPVGTGGTMSSLAGLSLRDTSAAFDVTIGATSSSALTAGRALTLDMGNVAHTLALGTTANTITFPNVASDTVTMLAATQTLTNKTLGAFTLSGDITTAAARIWTMPTGTAAALKVWNGATSYVQLNTDVNTNGHSNVVLLGADGTIASAANAQWNYTYANAGTLTLTGNTGNTDIAGLTLFVQAPTITNSTADTVTRSSTEYITGGPLGAGSATITNSVGLDIDTWAATNTTNAISLRINPPTGGSSTNTAILIAGVGNIVGASTLSLGTNTTANVNLQYNSSNVLSLTGTTAITIATGTTITGTTTFASALTLSNGGAFSGTFSGTPTWSGANTFSSSGTALTVTNTASIGSVLVTSTTIPTNGIYAPSATTIGISANGTGIVSSTSNVWTMKGSAQTVVQIVDSTSANTFSMQAQTTQTVLSNNNNLPLALYTNSSERFKIAAAGGIFMNNLSAGSGSPDTVCINTSTHELEENAAATCTVSAARFKDNLRPLNLDALTYLNQFTTWSYNYKTDSPDKVHYGLLADNLESIDTRLATYDSSGLLASYDLNAVLAIQTGAIQQLSAQIQGLQAQINTLRRNQQN